MVLPAAAAVGAAVSPSRMGTGVLQMTLGDGQHLMQSVWGLLSCEMFLEKVSLFHTCQCDAASDCLNGLVTT